MRLKYYLLGELVCLGLLGRCSGKVLALDPEFLAVQNQMCSFMEKREPKMIVR